MLNKTVRASVIGPTSQMPVSPKNCGKIKIFINRRKRPLENEMNADSFAFPIDVK